MPLGLCIIFIISHPKERNLQQQRNVIFISFFLYSHIKRTLWVREAVIAASQICSWIMKQTHCYCCLSRTHSPIERTYAVAIKSYEQLSEEDIEEHTETLEEQTDDIEENLHQGDHDSIHLSGISHSEKCSLIVCCCTRYNTDTHSAIKLKTISGKS